RQVLARAGQHGAGACSASVADDKRRSWRLQETTCRNAGAIKNANTLRGLERPAALAMRVDGPGRDARLGRVEVGLCKLGKGARAVAVGLVRAPRKGSVVVIEFPDGMHEYVTTPVKRVLRLAGREVFYIETINSRYRLEVRSREDAVAENAS